MLYFGQNMCGTFYLDIVILHIFVNIIYFMNAFPVCFIHESGQPFTIRTRHL